MERTNEMKRQTLCGNCYYHRRSCGAWVCNNYDSEYYGALTPYRCVCAMFTGKEDRFAEHRYK